jgi:hypothetical protein
MAHFAEIDSNNIVLKVVCMKDNTTQEDCKTIFNSDNRWIQTSYNTYAGEHRLGGTPLRKNYASQGFTYNETLDAFIPPRPFETWNSWILNEETCQWEPPTPRPEELPFGTVNKSLAWNENKLSWVVIDDPAPKDIPEGKMAWFDIENCQWIIEDIA